MLAIQRIARRRQNVSPEPLLGITSPSCQATIRPTETTRSYGTPAARLDSPRTTRVISESDLASANSVGSTLASANSVGSKGSLAGGGRGGPDRCDAAAIASARARLIRQQLQRRMPRATNGRLMALSPARQDCAQRRCPQERAREHDHVQDLERDQQDDERRPHRHESSTTPAPRGSEYGRNERPLGSRFQPCQPAKAVHSPTRVSPFTVFPAICQIKCNIFNLNRLPLNLFPCSAWEHLFGRSAYRRIPV